MSYIYETRQKAGFIIKKRQQLLLQKPKCNTLL
jgi:hypothetical protein